MPLAESDWDQTLRGEHDSWTSERKQGEVDQARQWSEARTEGKHYTHCQKKREEMSGNITNVIQGDAV